jgi:hypothetical protein
MYPLIVSAFPDSEEALLDPSSPQFAAFEWLLSPANSAVLLNRRVVQSTPQGITDGQSRLSCCQVCMSVHGIRRLLLQIFVIHRGTTL